MSANHRGRPRGTDELAGVGRWLAPLARHPWYFAITACAAIGLTTGGAAILLQGNGTPSHQVASGCGLINCSALPAPIPTTSTQSHISKAHTSVSHSPKPSAPPPSPTPSQAPAPAPAADVTVTLTSDRDRRDSDHFHDQLTLVNNGSSPVSGWTVQLTLPGDGIDSVETQSGWDGVSFDHWQFSGDTLTMSADTDRETIDPGESLDVSIHGRGRTASPTECTFNSATCPTLRWQQDQQPPQQDQQSGQEYQQPLQQPDQSSGQPDQQPLQQDQRSWQQDHHRSWPDHQYQGWR